MAFFKNADTSKVLTSFKTPMLAYRGWVLHVAVSESLFPSYGRGLGAHFYVRRLGSFAQQIDTKFRGGHAYQGNATLLGIETQGGMKNAQGEPWTPEQVETIAWIIAMGNIKHGIPIKVMANSRPSSKGVGTHRLGCTGNYSKGRPGRVAGGEVWSTARGKVCPGDAKIDQVAEIVKRAKKIAAEYKKQDKAEAKAPAAKPAGSHAATDVRVLKRGMSGKDVEKLQAGLNRVFPSYRFHVSTGRGKLLAVDGHFGPAVTAWVKEFQGRVGLARDGVVGPKTRAALRKSGVKF